MSESFFPEEPPATAVEAPDHKEESTPKEPKVKSISIEMGEFSSEEGRLAAIIAYIPILCFVPLLNMRENKEARFHARQGVLLFLLELVAVLFLIDGVSRFVFRVLLVAAIGFSVLGIVLALQGRSYRLPLISEIAEKVKL